MEKIKRTVLDAGPLIHLHEINEEETLEIIGDIFITEEVAEEFKRYIRKNMEIKPIKLSQKAKNYTEILMQRHNIDLGEAEAIALAKQERINLFFTDDWYAREVAEHLNIETHGVLGIVLRAYREKLITEKQALNTLNKLQKDSSLFITREIIDEAKTKVKKFRNSS